MFFLFRNSLSDQRLLMAALACVWCVRLGLWLLPFRVVSSMVDKFIRANSISDQSKELQLARKVGSIVRRVSRYVPAASCLTQALATHVLLARSGHRSHLRIGVTKGVNGGLDAHAWVESNGKIIIGRRNDLRKYTLLHRFEETTPHDDRILHNRYP